MNYNRVKFSELVDFSNNKIIGKDEGGNDVCVNFVVDNKQCYKTNEVIIDCESNDVLFVRIDKFFVYYQDIDLYCLEENKSYTKSFLIDNNNISKDVYDNIEKINEKIIKGKNNHKFFEVELIDKKVNWYVELCDETDLLIKISAIRMNEINNIVNKCLKGMSLELVSLCKKIFNQNISNDELEQLYCNNVMNIKLDNNDNLVLRFKNDDLFLGLTIETEVDNNNNYKTLRFM